MKKGIVFFLIVIVFSMNAQEKLPYHQIPTAPETYTSTTVAARMIDGLGFRYYWATEGLRIEDLEFKPNDEARTTEETINHILGLSQVILNAVLKVPNGTPQPKMTFVEKRIKTLENLEKASTLLKASKDLADYKMVFQRQEKTTEFPFWNVINGPISDALWHVGQVVSFRRSSGNPFPKDVNVLTGKAKN